MGFFNPDGEFVSFDAFTINAMRQRERERVFAREAAYFINCNDGQLFDTPNLAGDVQRIVMPLYTDR